VCKNELLLNGREISVQSGIEQLRHSCVRWAAMTTYGKGCGFVAA
jgi:hypothetical protein